VQLTLGCCQASRERHATARGFVVVYFDRDALERGIDAALARLGSYDLPFSPTARFQDTVGLTAGALESWPEELQPRFIEMFAENVAVSAAAREMFGDPPLTHNDIMAYLAVDCQMKNSWKHAR
jgi:hypothetical protein